MNASNDRGQGAAPQLDPALAARALVLDSLAADLIRLFQEAGAEAVLLKGPSLADWLYVGHMRSYGDCDILVDPACIDVASEVLADRGFEPAELPRARPSMASPVAIPWGRAGASIDLHRSFWGIGAPAEQAWSVLSDSTEIAQVARAPVPVLRRPARLLLVVLHAAHHGDTAGGPLKDLERAHEVATDAEWEGAARLARTLRAEGAFTAGLQLTAAGEARASSLGVARRRPLGSLLSGAGLPMSEAFQRLTWAESPRQRVEIMVGTLFPSREFMRWRYPRATRSSPGLVFSYVLRLGQVTGAALRAGTIWWQRRRRGGPT